jgi:hypothetical protein
MNIEDFKKIVAGYEIGDELKLEELCAKWNEDLDRSEQEEREEVLYGRIRELEELLQKREDEIVMYDTKLGTLEVDLENTELALAELLEQQFR